MVDSAGPEANSYPQGMAMAEAELDIHGLPGLILIEIN